LVNTLFWKILVTRVKRKVSEFDYDGFVAFVTVLGAKRWLKPGFRDERERDPNVATISRDCPIRSRSAERGSGEARRAAKRGGLIIQAQLVISPDGGLATAIRNNLASAVSEGEAR